MQKNRECRDLDDFLHNAVVGMDLKHKAFKLSNGAPTGRWHYTDHSTPSDAKNAVEKGLPGYVANEVRVCVNKYQVEWFKERSKEEEA